MATDPGRRLFNQPPSAEGPGPMAAHDFRMQVISATLYVVGISLGAAGCAAAFLWAPLLWCAPAGLLVIAVSFIFGGARR